MSLIHPGLKWKIPVTVTDDIVYDGDKVWRPARPGEIEEKLKRADAMHFLRKGQKVRLDMYNDCRVGRLTALVTWEDQGHQLLLQFVPCKYLRDENGGVVGRFDRIDMVVEGI